MKDLHFCFMATVAHSITGETIAITKGVSDSDKERARNQVFATCQALAQVVWPDDPKFAIYIDQHIPKH